MYSSEHRESLKQGEVVEGSFERPWRPIAKESDEEESEESDDSTASSARLKPLSAKKARPTPTPKDTPSSEDTAGEQDV